MLHNSKVSAGQVGATTKNGAGRLLQKFMNETMSVAIMLNLCPNLRLS
jgi:hypothetical protein